MARAYKIDHRLAGTDANVHNEWNNELPPRLTVSPGATIRLECPVGFDHHVSLESTREQFHADWDPIGHNLVGPIAVEGARPGDILEVEILDVQHGGWGFTFFRPGREGKGLLPDEFDEPGFFLWDLTDSVGRFVEGIEIPLDPFPGNLGVAPAEAGTHSTIPPRAVGGNIDVPQLTAGSTAYFPIAVEDALFSIGDGHAAQGDGEVCLSAIETPMLVTVRVDLHSDRTIERPHFRVTPSQRSPDQNDSTYVTTGVAPDLYEASQQAGSAMVNHLTLTHDLTREHAYILCSVAMDLRISEIVNEPRYVVTGHLPESIFPT